jgi:hypothetical protein
MPEMAAAVAAAVMVTHTKVQQAVAALVCLGKAQAA